MKKSIQLSFSNFIAWFTISSYIKSAAAQISDKQAYK